MAVWHHSSHSGMSRRTHVRRGVLLAVLAGIVVLGSALVANAVVKSAPSGHNLVAAGPVSSENGFPTSYTDDAGTRLELCLPTDPLCSAAPPLPDPGQPLSFPDNFPDEGFYSLVGAGVNTGSGGRAVLTLSAEAAFANGAVAAGDQVTFGRVRIKVSGLTPGETYTVTHPYGVDEFVAEEGLNNINFTEDVGIGVPGTFTGILSSRIGPFLRWDAGAPAGYLGDPAIDHAITGSPYGTNFFRIEGPNAGGPGVNVARTDLFSVMGKRAVNAGVDPVRATYSRPATPQPATGGTIDVYATSEPDQSITVSGDGFDATQLAGHAKRYFGRVDYSGAQPPAAVTVTNGGDNPPAKKSIAVTDAVTITKALYDADADRLTIEADSSDKASPPKLTATGIGELTAGSLTVENLTVAPPDVTVTSAAGGSATLPVQATGAGFAPIPVHAFAGVDQVVQQGQTVTLDASQSTGTVKSYSWTQTAGGDVTLSSDSVAKPTFVAPSSQTDLEFKVTVTGPGGPSEDTVAIHVAAANPPVAAAGADRTVPQGTTVNLDGSASANATTYSWQQTGGTPEVTLKDANTATPSFTFPRFAGPLTFTLTVTGPGGSATDEVTITGAADRLTAGIARYTTSKREYDLGGTATQLGANTVTVHVGRTLDGAVIGTAAVDPLTGAWRLRQANSNVPLDASRTISVESARGGRLLAVPVQVK